MSPPGVVCALLAAGASTRLGRPKQLLTRAGTPLISHVLTQLRAAGCDRYAVIVGSHAELIRPVLDGAGCELLYNPDWAEGIAASIRLAAEWAEREHAAALLLAVCDQPRLTSLHASALCRAHAAHGGAVASAYAGTRGTPAIFPAAWYSQLRQLRGERGAGGLLRGDASVQLVDWPDGAVDIDVEADSAASGWL